MLCSGMGISRLPDVEANKPAKKKFKRYPDSVFFISTARQCMVYMHERGPGRSGKMLRAAAFVCCDRPHQQFAFVSTGERANRRTRHGVPRSLGSLQCAYKIHIVFH